MKPDLQTDDIKENNFAEEEFDTSEQSKWLKKLLVVKSKLLVVKSKFLWLGLTLAVGAILLLISLPSFFDNSALKFQIEQKASQSFNSNLVINGDIEVRLLPYPAIIANEVLLRGYKKNDKIYNLYAKSVKLKLSLLNFLIKDFVISKVLFYDAILEYFYSSNSAFPRQDKFTEISTKIDADQAQNHEKKSGDFSLSLFHVDKFQDSQLNSGNMPDLEIKNGTLISYNRNSVKKEIGDINSLIKSDTVKIYAAGKFTNEQISNNFRLTAYFNSDASKHNSVLELSSESMNLIVRGGFTTENHDIITSDFIGKVEAEIFDLRSFYKDYMSNNSAIYKKLQPSAKSIKISADIKNSGGEIALDSIVINSNLLNGTGNAMLDFSSDIPRIDVSLDLDNLDLDAIWSSDRIDSESVEITPNITTNNSDEVVETTSANNSQNDLNPVNSSSEAEKKPEELDLQIVNQIKNFDISAEIKSHNVKYLEGKITDLSLYLTVSKDGQILILPMILNIPGEGILRVNGTLDSGKNLPKFLGKLDASGNNLGDVFKWLKIESPNLKFDNLKNYIIYSDVMLTPNNITLDNFYLNLNKGQSEFLGSIQIDNTSKVTNFTNNFRISSFDVDDYFLTSGQNAYLSSGSLLKKLLWLNDIPSINNVSLVFDKLIYKDEEFSNQSGLKLQIKQGYLEVSELSLKSDKTNLKATLAVDISAQDPRFQLNVVADSLHYEAPQSPKTKNDTDEKKITISDQFFSSPSLDGFNGTINLDANNLELDDLQVKNVKFSGKLKDGNISDSSLTCNMYGGNFTYKGLVGLKDYKTINGNIVLNNANLSQLLSDLISVSNIDGVVNVSANLTSLADSKKAFLTESISEIKFNAGSPTITGYGLSDLVNKMFYPANFRQELQQPELILTNPNSKTTLKQASGTIIFGKDHNNKFSINFSAPAINGILSGKVNLASNSFDGLTNVIFVTGSRQKQIPLNIATALKGDFTKPSSSINLDQVRQYLGLPKLNPSTAATTTNTTTNNKTTSDSLPIQAPPLVTENLKASQ